MWFFLSIAVQYVQQAFNTQLASNMWLTPSNWNSFNLANTLTNNIWIFFLVFLVLGLAYYGYNEAQRRNNY